MSSYVCFPVHIYRQVFKHEDGSESTLYLCTSDLTLSASNLTTIYKKRWKVEEYHKSLKSNASFSKSPARRVGSQLNHLFCSVVAFVKLEVCRLGSGLNHFAQKAKLYHAAMVSAFALLQADKRDKPALAITL